MLEKMGEFFDSRLVGYDEHMLTNIESAEEFYLFTAGCLPTQINSNILDLGCGTGLELEYYFRLNPNAHITGIDLAPGMLNALKEKFPDKQLDLILGSYFDVPLVKEYMMQQFLWNRCIISRKKKRCGYIASCASR